MSVTHIPVVVIGGGVAGLAAAWRAARQLGPGHVALLERASRVGGKIQTVHRDGFLLEAGPDSLLASKPGGLDLLRDLGLDAGLITPDPGMRGAFVRRRNRLYPLPEGMSGLVPARIGPLLRTPLLSLPGRVRAACEWFAARRASNEDESLASFARRRFGREAWSWLVEPLLGGIYAGDGTALSLHATFPQLADAERRHGGVLRAMLAAQRSPAPSTRTGFVTLEHGMGTLAAALGEALADEIHTGVEVTSVSRDRDGYRVECQDGRTWVANAVILATPAHLTAGLVAPIDGALADLLGTIPFVSVATVSVAYASRDVARPLRGTGWISPRAEGGAVVACTWTSNKFRGRAPAGHTLLRLFVGRAGHDAIVASDNGALLALVRATLARTHDIRTEPLFSHVHRWPLGMPQYTMGHLARLAAMEGRLDAHAGLLLAGSSYHGVGIPDCIRSGWSAADRAMATLGVPA